MLLTQMESQILMLEWVEWDTEDEELVDENDKKLLTGQSTSPPPERLLLLTSYSMPPTVTDSMSSLAFNLPLCLSQINEKSALSSSPFSVWCEGQSKDRGPSYCFIHCQSSPPIGRIDDLVEWLWSGLFGWLCIILYCLVCMPFHKRGDCLCILCSISPVQCRTRI